MIGYRRLFFSVTLFAIIVWGLTSCSESNNIEVEKYLRNLATINEIEKKTSNFTLDDGTRLWVVEPIELNLESTNKRTLVDYIILSTSQDGYDCVVKLNGYYEVPTRDIVYIKTDNTEELDAIGNDPIKIISLWLGGGYLNVHFEFSTAGKIKHRLNLIESNLYRTIGDDPVKLEIRHNQMEDPKNYPQKGYICFNLAPYENTKKEQIKFDIRWLDNNGQEKSLLLIYKKNKTTESIPSHGITNEKYDTNLNIY